MTTPIREQIAGMVLRALSEAQASGDLPQAQVDDPAIERPNNPDHGDFSCSLPLKLARPMRMDPMSIAEKLAARVSPDDTFQCVWTARPGFLNFGFSPSWLAEQVDTIRESGSTYGNVDFGAGQRVQVEFVSINPTGPLHVGHARGAVFGSALANVLAAAGHDVVREYYFNDSGGQMDRFYKTLYARYAQLNGRPAELPPDGYSGAYMIDLAEELKQSEGDGFLHLTEEEGASELGKLGIARMMEAIRADIRLLRIDFDVWFSEASLYENGQFEKAMRLLRKRDYVVERDGAVWFASTSLGEEQDKVLIRGTGEPTYFATDVAYHYNKFVEREFDRVINVLGADHQGHVAQMKPVVRALGVSPDRLSMIVHQMVTLKRGDQVVKASKRTGDIVTLRELVDEVGTDACRFVFLSRSPESQMEFDLELAKKQSPDNPVYYIQYGYARIAQILALARDREIDHSDAQLSLLTHDAELALIRKMVELPELIEMMARTLEPHHLPHYSQELSTAFHRFYEECRVVSSEEGDEEITKARLTLCEAARTVLSNCLSLMSMTAPEHM